jgi:hypothetical protein
MTSIIKIDVLFVSREIIEKFIWKAQILCLKLIEIIGWPGDVLNEFLV